MPRKTLASLGALVRAKRGERKLRETAREIGIGPATLMRIEGGRVPDVTTFAKVCRWLEINPDAFLGFDQTPSSSALSQPEPSGPRVVAAHLRADQTPTLQTAEALAKMIILAAESQVTVDKEPGDVIP